MKLKDKIAFVTGAAGGIGKSIAIAFAGQGAHIAVCDINQQGAEDTTGDIRILGVKSVAVCGDLTVKRDVEEMVQKASNSLGPIDILVNCAGISKIHPFLEITEDQWDRTIRVNLKSVFLTCQTVLPDMQRRRTGVIINMSSQSGKRGASWYADYCASKFAIVGLTQCLAQEFSKDGIRINAVCPGIIETGLWDEAMWEGYARKRDLKVDEVRDYLINNIPIKRLGKPEDVAKVAVFLASDDSSYMTGQAINVTGGALMS